MCECCKINKGEIDTFIGKICKNCDEKTTQLAELKAKEWNLYRGWNESK